MLGTHYYHGIIRKHIVAFGNMFNDIVVQRLDTNNNRVQTIPVPIAYGPREKFLTKLAANPNLDQDVAITLPRIGFELTSMIYVPTRKVGSTHKNRYTNTGDSDKISTQYTPVPYDLFISVSVMVRNYDDGSQIIEQIVPYFRPEFTLNINTIPEMGITSDVPVVLNNVGILDEYEGDFKNRRALIWSLDFLMKANFYGPVQTGQGVIKRAYIDMYANTDLTSSRIERITLTPGLLANGSPTTNSAASVAISQISANSDFGFAVDIGD